MSASEHKGLETDEKHIMIAATTGENSRRAVMYVANMLGGLPGFRVTIYSLISVPPDDFFASGVERDEWIGKEKEQVDEALAQMLEVCLQAGFPEDKVAVVSEARRCASASDCLIQEAMKIKACTLVVGRRGLSKREEFQFGSTSTRLIHDAHDCAVWIVE